MEDIKVSIICNAYNQEDYIRDALESFVMQKTDFAFEVLVHDDASTDNTAKIIKEFEEKYPQIIKPIYQTENQYSKGISIGKTFAYPRAKGKYIAFCEGDDYWTDENKLQKQYDVMEAHPEVDMCAHTTNMVYAETKKFRMKLQPSKTERILSTSEVILGGGGYVSTNSLFFRKSLFENEPPFRKLLQLDYTLQILGSLKGGIYYLPETMSAYRFMAKGSWSTKFEVETKHIVSIQTRLINMLNQLNADTDYQYRDDIDHVIKQSQFRIYRNTNNNKELLKKEYKELFRKLSLKNRLKIRIKAYFPFLITIKEKIKKITAKQ